jgi:O-antigen ligase
LSVNRRNARVSGWGWSLSTQLLSAVAAGVGLAVAATVITPTALFVLCVGAVVAGLILRRPEHGALAVVCLTLIVPRDILFGPGVPIGGGALKVTDVLVGLTLASWLVHRAVDPAARRLPSRLTRSLVLAVLAVVAFGVLTGVERGNPLQLALTDLRPFLSLALVFPLIARIRTVGGVRDAVGILLGASLVGSAWIIGLYVTGSGSEATFSSGSLRITEVTFLGPMLGSIWAIILLPHVRRIGHRVAVVLVAGISLTALFFTLQRGAWLALFVGIMAAAALMTPRRRARLLAGLAMVAAIGAVGVTAFNAASSAAVANPFESGLQRLQSVGAYSVDVSALHREAESAEAVRQIRHHPLTGLGMGGSISFYSPMYNSSTGQPGLLVTTQYLHNSYTWISIKTGLVGLLALVTLVLTTVARGILVARRSGPSGADRVLAMGFVATLGALVAASFTGPHLTSDPVVPYIALVIAGIDVLWLTGRRVPRQEDVL